MKKLFILSLCIAYNSFLVSEASGINLLVINLCPYDIYLSAKSRYRTKGGTKHNELKSEKIAPYTGPNQGEYRYKVEMVGPSAFSTSNYRLDIALERIKVSRTDDLSQMSEIHKKYDINRKLWRPTIAKIFDKDGIPQIDIH